MRPVRRRKNRQNVPHGHAYIKSTFNNTIVSITDPNGVVLSWASSGQVGFKGSRKSTRSPHSLQLNPQLVVPGIRCEEVDVFVKGPGSGRDRDSFAPGDWH